VQKGKTMLLGFITLLSALSLSTIAAYYSIVGLTAIFAAAVIPVIVMGVALETAKVVTTLWLHYNWERAEWKIKTYLVSAVIVLMFITSMGIFGLLSKSHADQAVPTGDIQAQVLLFDEKIKTQRDNIESSRKALAQLDSAVDQMLARTDTEQGATKSANLRRSQKKERTRLQQDIDDSQKVITKLQEDRAPIASKFRQVVADVGPIRYIAALIYGDNTDQNMLEDAVRWVIIIIVAVFDPLAIILLIAATTSIDWAKAKKLIDREKKDSKSNDEKIAALLAQKEIEYEQKLNAEIKSITANIASSSSAIDTKSVANLVDTATAGVEAANTELSTVIKIMQNDTEQVHQVTAEEKEIVSSMQEEISDLKSITELTKDRNALLAEQLAASAQLIEELSVKKDQEKTSDYQVIDAAPVTEEEVEEVIADAAPVTEEEVIAGTLNADTGVVEFAVTVPEANQTVEEPVLETLPDEPVNTANFGITFPSSPVKGDLFLRVDYNPNKLFKWVGGKWIETNKLSTDAYAYSEEYIKLLVAQIGSGETDIDDCTPTEQAQIAEYLEKTAVTKEQE